MSADQVLVMMGAATAELFVGGMAGGKVGAVLQPAATASRDAAIRVMQRRVRVGMRGGSKGVAEGHQGRFCVDSSTSLVGGASCRVAYTACPDSVGRPLIGAVEVCFPAAKRAKFAAISALPTARAVGMVSFSALSDMDESWP